MFLNLIMSIKRKIININGKVKEINIKNETHYFFDDMINLENFESNLSKIDKKHYKSIDIYYIGYMTIKKN